MSKKLNAAILGAGFMGQTHARNAGEIEGVSLCAVCDANEEAAAALAKDSSAAVYTDFDAMIEGEKIDVLYVCLPPFAHNGQVEKAAAKGIHLFLEKPIALNAVQAASMVDAIDKAGVVSQVGFHYRFRKGVNKMKELIASGEAGKPTQFQGRYWCNMLGGAWWRDQSKSGGQLFEQICHIYDLSRYLLGEGDVANGFLNNLCHTEIEDYTIEDTSMGMVRHKNGALTSIAGSNCAVPDHFIGDFRVVCEKVVLDYRSTGDWRITDESFLFYNEDGKVREEKYDENENVYLEENRDFIAAVRNGGKTRTPAAEGLSGIKLVSAVVESAGLNGAPVTL